MIVYGCVNTTQPVINILDRYMQNYKKLFLMFIFVGIKSVDTKRQVLIVDHCPAGNQKSMCRIQKKNMTFYLLMCAERFDNLGRVTIKCPMKSGERATCCHPCCSVDTDTDILRPTCKSKTLKNVKCG